MKKIILGFLALFLSVGMYAQNYSYFDNDVRFYNDGTNPVVTLSHFGAFPITEKFGFTDYAVIEGSADVNRVGLVLLGGYYNVTKELSVYLMAGKESLSTDVRFGGILYYTTGDKFRAYASYQRNQLGFTSKTKDSEWYDIQARFAIVSKEKNSFYAGGRYMKYYGIGVPLSVRQSMSKNSNLILGYTTYYDIDNSYGGDWLPTVTLAFEFL